MEEKENLDKQVQRETSTIDLDEIVRKYDTEARFRKLQGWQYILVSVIAVSFSLFHLYTGGFGLLMALKQRSVHLAFAVVLIFLLYPAYSKASKTSIPWYDFVLAAIAAYATTYVIIEYNQLINRAGLPTTTDIVMGFIAIALMLEATRRISNPVLPVIAICFILYAYLGRYMPGLFAHRGYNTIRIINHMYLGTEGIFGTPLGVSSTFVFMFILFGSVLEQTGMGKFIIDISMALAGGYTGGPAKVAVVSSGLMGSINGSSVANVCTTGAFTIPLMKSVGYKPYFAGAVEAVASTGGQIMPPVMGAAAFIMAELLGIPYIQVALAAIIPALLYYFAVFVQVHLEANRLGLRGLPRDRLPKVGPLMKEKGHLLIPLGVIVYMLLAGYTPIMAAFWAIVITVVIAAIKKETRLGPQKLFTALEGGARGALGVAAACATVGIVVGTATLTGLGLRIASAIITLAGGNLLLTLLLTMVACILLGAGLPTTANFIVTSTMAAPALLQLNVPPMAAYMFVLYFGIAADLSPPVALAAYAGAGIAGADPMKTGVTAMKLALAGFIVPFIYVFNPVLVLVNATIIEVLLALVTALVGVFCLGMSTVGFYKVQLNIFERALAMVGALLLLKPGIYTDIAGLCILLALHFYLSSRERAQKTQQN